MNNHEMLLGELKEFKKMQQTTNVRLEHKVDILLESYWKQKGATVFIAALVSALMGSLIEVLR